MVWGYKHIYDAEQAFVHLGVAILSRQFWRYYQAKKNQQMNTMVKTPKLGLLVTFMLMNLYTFDSLLNTYV